jgi:hypothetical protein
MTETAKVRLRVVISCVTFETVKIVQPIEYLRGDKVYLIHMSSRNGPSIAPRKTDIYQEFYDEVHRQILDLGIGEDSIVEMNLDIMDLSGLMQELLPIMEREVSDGNEVLVNVSAGSTEYILAATLASMMVKGAKPFIVHNRRYSMSDDQEVRKAYYRNGKPVGLAAEVGSPKYLPPFSIEKPKRDLIVGLRVLRKNEGKNGCHDYSKMIKGLQEMGVWTHEPRTEHDGVDGSGKKRQTEKMYYCRHFIDRWMDEGWVEANDAASSRKRKALKLTDEGKNMIDIFYKEDA